MDGSTVDHSDSDSGESWTLLENHPAYGEDAPDFAENSPNSTPIKREHTEAHLEKDEDTDGISIISDSDPESAPSDFTCDKCLSSENPSQLQNMQYPLNDVQQPNKKTIESICNEADFLGDGSHKLKTYVHRRNKRLSMVLNIIMLGSVITAAGVAIGHMWGAKHECTTPSPSVNKILSNLYKLQEENAYLRNKLRELSLPGNMQPVLQPQSDEPKKQVKHRCKKIFEVPLNHKGDNDKAFKCIDEDSTESVKKQEAPELLSHEKEFLSGIGKLKKVYNQNKSWLDDHIQRRLSHENNMMRNKRKTEEADSDAEKDSIDFKGIIRGSEIAPAFKLPNLEEHDGRSNTSENDFITPESDIKTKSHKAWNLRKQMDGRKFDVIKKNKKNEKQTESKDSHNLDSQNLENLSGSSSSESFENINLKKHESILTEASQTKEKKISYADSLRTDSQNVHNRINYSNEQPIRGIKGYGYKRNHGDVELMLNMVSSSEDEIKKDDRYTGPKMKKDKKKHDRNKVHKKQKRKNKYEQWEMKGGYMKDFDEFSMTSSQVNLGNDAITNPVKKYLNNDFENYLAKLTEADQMNQPKKSEDSIKLERTEKGAKAKNKNQDWYDKRYTLRAEARRKLEQELFGESSPNNAAWYFRRVNKREQCRAQKDNSTFKKFSKQKMNFKMKR